MRPDIDEQLAMLMRERRFVEVIELWRRASLASPTATESSGRLAAAAMAQLGDLSSSDLLLSDLLGRGAKEAATWALAARIAADLGRHSESVDRWERATSINVDNTVWWRWLGETAIKAHSPERALANAGVHRLRFNQNVDLAIVYASLLVAANRHQEALIEFERILARWPGHSVAGPAFVEFVIREFPVEAFDLLATVDWRPSPAVLSAAEVRAAAILPSNFVSNASSSAWRERMTTELRRLTELATSSLLTGDARARCLATTPFFAAYTEADVTALQFAWGDFVEALVAPLRLELPPTSVRTAGMPLRKVGFVTNRATDSSAGRFFNSWLYLLKAAGFSVVLYAIGATDSVTDQLEREFIVYRHENDDVASWRAIAMRLAADRNDVLIFPEPQGSQLIQLVAGIRFAPIQCAAFGNPVTTGLTTMDYFFVPDDAEVASPGAHYREQVIRLAGSGTTITAAPKAAKYLRESFGFLDHEHIYLASQNFLKWTPNFIDAVIEILQRDPIGRLVFFAVSFGGSVRAFEAMLRTYMNEAGLRYSERVSVVGLLPRESYLALHVAADVSLDTFGFSGGSSTFDALSAGLPVIAMEGKFLRGRQSSALLRRHGQAANIAKTVEEYVDFALATAQSRRAKARSGLELSVPRSLPVAFPLRLPREEAGAVYADVVDFFSVLTND